MNLINKLSHKISVKFLKVKLFFNFPSYNLKASKNKFTILLCTFIIIAFTLGRLYGNGAYTLPGGDTFVHFINVGQGDAVLIKNYNFTLLIDSGSNEYADELISYLKNNNIKKLDYVIATHPHEDHIGAMDDIINTFPVDTVIAPKVTTKDADFINLINSLTNKNLKINVVTDNTTINFTQENYITFLWSGNTHYDNINNNSLVLKYTNKDISFLFTGDIEKEVESQLQYLPPHLIESTVLKVAHHGSNSSSTINFLNTVNPNISVISCGIGNDYGHPHKNTLKNLSNIYSSIYRTDIHGNIIIKTDGSKVWINSEHAD